MSAAKKLACFFWNLIDGFFGDHWFKNFSWVVRTAIYALNGTVWEEEISFEKWKKFCDILLKLERKLLGTWDGFFQRFFFRIVFLAYRGTVSWKQFFWSRSIFHHLQKCSGKILDFAKIPQDCCKYLILSIQGNLLRFFLKWKKFDESFQPLTKFFRKFAKTFRAFLKTEPRESGWRIEGNVFLPALNSFFERYRHFEHKFFV